MHIKTNYYVVNYKYKRIFEGKEHIKYETRGTGDIETMSLIFQREE